MFAGLESVEGSLEQQSDPELEYLLGPDGDVAVQAAAEEERIGWLEQEIQRGEEQAREADGGFGTSHHQLELLGKDRKRLDSLTSGYSQLLSHTPASEKLEQPVEKVPVQDMSQQLDELETVLQQALQEEQQLDRKRNQAVQAIIKWIDEEGSKTGNTLASQLRAWSEEAYEQECASLMNQLALRAQQLDAAIRELEPHHAMILEEVLIAAEQGISILKSVTQRSKLPLTLTRFRGQPFLKITLSEIPDPAGKRARIEQYIADILQSGTVPPGLELVQQAVRRLTHPIKVSILSPDRDASLPYVPVSAMMKQSGGERLTSTVLLYCTLAQLRAVERGKMVSRSSSLLLDNPLGTASRSEFLELQREVARAMHIQLIYATGIIDYEAIGMFPHIVRLKNNRIDRATGERVVEVDPGEGHLEAVHLLFPEKRLAARQIAQVSDEKGEDNDGSVPES